MPENGARLDRIEQVIEGLTLSHEKLIDSQKHLLTAQVVLTEQVEKLTDEVRTGFREVRELIAQNTAAIAELRTAQALTDERFRALIDTLRNPPRN